MGAAAVACTTVVDQSCTDDSFVKDRVHSQILAPLGFLDAGKNPYAEASSSGEQHGGSCGSTTRPSLVGPPAPMPGSVDIGLPRAAQPTQGPHIATSAPTFGLHETLGRGSVASPMTTAPPPQQPLLQPPPQQPPMQQQTPQQQPQQQQQ
eukprot:CAMPEP_0204055628 /NCGR_PEP_ID=MMETSP0360-20130528/130817_1 /ASSEMBLY_ACC=CAM_ASM_000342 /TAXON_ID=268821 /ORGANISM="Scrippsiella Hangoei, Strain SHTV-5" /LENGTH=149 /DNA_ID=CAMNT_0051002997 /DNA_START=83 /DNA_END=529 /DNA_ORIENTATION=-